jgi:hypothetical protein
MSAILKNSLILLFFRLPLILIIISFFLGLSLGNVGLIFLCLGQIFIVPIVVWALQKFFMFFYTVPYSDILLFAHDDNYDGTEINVTPSYWVTQVVFFFVYLIVNAWLLLDLTKTDSTSSDAKKEKENNRKLRMKVILVFTVLTLAALLVIRWKSNTESVWEYNNIKIPVGLLIGTVAGAFLGWGFYYAVKEIIKIDFEMLDVFGVKNQMIETKDFSKPYMCTA